MTDFDEICDKVEYIQKLEKEGGTHEDRDTIIRLKDRLKNEELQSKMYKERGSKYADEVLRLEKEITPLRTERAQIEGDMRKLMSEKMACQLESLEAAKNQQGLLDRLKGAEEEIKTLGEGRESPTLRRIHDAHEE